MSPLPPALLTLDDGGSVFTTWVLLLWLILPATGSVFTPPLILPPPPPPLPIVCARGAGTDVSEDGDVDDGERGRLRRAPMATGTGGGDSVARGENAARVGKVRWGVKRTHCVRRVMLDTMRDVGLGVTASKNLSSDGGGPSGRGSNVSHTHRTAATAEDTGVCSRMDAP